MPTPLLGKEATSCLLRQPYLTSPIHPHLPGTTVPRACFSQKPQADRGRPHNSPGSRGDHRLQPHRPQRQDKLYTTAPNSGAAWRPRRTWQAVHPGEQSTLDGPRAALRLGLEHFQADGTLRNTEFVPTVILPRKPKRGKGQAAPSPPGAGHGERDPRPAQPLSLPNGQLQQATTAAPSAGQIYWENKQYSQGYREKRD